jgi:phytoene dehydrogenase-like protein
MRDQKLDRAKIAIIGAGQSALSCAAYLARAGAKVDLYEKQEQAGGLCINETPFKRVGSDAIVSSVASYYGMLRQEVIDELELYKHGLQPYLSNPIEIVLLDNDQYVFTPREAPDQDESVPRVKIDGLDDKQIEGWQAFWTDIQKAASIIYPLYFDSTTTQKRVKEVLIDHNLPKIADAIFDKSLEQLLDQYLSNPAYKAVAATCTPGFANLVGSVFGCIHHGTASTLEIFGAWGQVRGGMGQVTQAMQRSAEAHGARVHPGKAVKKIQIQNGRVEAVLFEDGQRLDAADFDYVLASQDIYNLFENLIGFDEMPGDIKDYLSANRPSVSAAKLHFLLSEMPVFKTLAAIKHNHKGVIVMAPSMESVRKDSQAVPKGSMPLELMLTMAFPHLDDETLSRDVVLTVDVHYLPARLEGGRKWTDDDDKALQQAVLQRISQQCPEIGALVRDCYVVSPNALAGRFAVASTSCWHMPMTPAFLFEKRALPGCAPYQTPYANLYTIGSGNYPAGNVTGCTGRNAASLIMEKLQK